MPPEIVELLSCWDSRHAHQRMKLDAIEYIKKDVFDFRRFGDGGEPTSCVLINSLDIGLDKHPSLFQTLQKRAQTAVIMLFVADLYPRTVQSLPLWSSVVDVFLVPTPEMRNFLCAFTERPVEVLIDPIDFCLADSLVKPARDDKFKVVWFGYPESYQKSMGIYEKALFTLHQNNEIEYHVVSKNNSYGVLPTHEMHEYQPDSFLSLLNAFDVCVLSHAPLDYFVNTFWKSENKAVLAINRGLPCVASRTPAYERLFNRCGIQEYLFSSISELVSSLRRLKSCTERDQYLAKSQAIVLENYAATRMADDWQQLYRKTQAQKFPQLA